MSPSISAIEAQGIGLTAETVARGDAVRPREFARDTALPYHAVVFEFIETPFFTKAVLGYLSDLEYSRLQSHLNAQPESGAVIPGSGGLRKLRWGVEGRGKRGGLRVIYYPRKKRGEIWMLTLYGKSAREDIPVRVLKKIREAIDHAEEN